MLKFFYLQLFYPRLQFALSAEAQMPRRGGNQIAVTGWADDTHYLFKSFDENKNLLPRSVDVKTGKRIVYNPELSGRDQIAALLPAGTSFDE